MTEPAAVTAPAPQLHARWLGRVPYREAWDLQRAVFSARVRDEGEDHLLLLEHPHTYTLGRRTDPANLLLDEPGYAALGAEVVAVDRGGDVTYHGPGQLVVYPILRLGRPDVVAHVRDLEQIVIRTLDDFGVAGVRVDGLSGVWVGTAASGETAKVASVGCRVTRGVTMHGIALNVDPDMSFWRHIVGCGIRGAEAVSLRDLLGTAPPMRDVTESLVGHAADVFGRVTTFAAGSWPRRDRSTAVVQVRSRRAEAVAAGPDVKAQARERPHWLRRRAALADPGYVELRALMRRLELHTVCEEAGCPNIYECWSDRTATLMILGRDCTRSCGFCEVSTAKPQPLDPDEPRRVAEAVDEMGLGHAVLTSVARDDLPDGGAAVFAACVEAIRQRRPSCRVEVLVPDFRGDAAAASTVFEAAPDVFNHNLETVARLQSLARPQAGYARSLALLGRARAAGLVTKSGLVLGMGETEAETLEAMADLRAVGVGIVTLGQYLRPSARHLPVDRWVDPSEFDRLRRAGEDMGFDHVEAGPLVRSSYHARSSADAASVPARRSLS